MPEEAETQPPSSGLWTCSVPEAGRRYYGVSRNRSYELARTGVMPTIRVGERGLRALPRQIEKQLAGDA
jgi:hypothetical protein